MFIGTTPFVEFAKGAKKDVYLLSLKYKRSNRHRNGVPLTMQKHRLFYYIIKVENVNKF